MKTAHNAYRVIIFLLICGVTLQCKKKDKDNPSPVITSINPVSGIIGDPVIISGTDLLNASQVTFNGTASTIIQNSATRLTTIVPGGVVPGSSNVIVQTAAGNSNPAEFEVIKTPEHVDLVPPTLSKTIPAVNYTDYPLLIYGDNLSGTIRVTFNDINANIITNNQKVVTTTIPSDLPAGPVTIKVTTVRGTATISFEVQGPPPGGPAALDFSIVDIPPPAYVPGISNNWTCGLFSKETDSTFVDLNSDPEFDQTYFINGKFEFDFKGDYNSLNYIEFTNTETGETFAGQFSSTSGTPCILKMILISSKTGTLSECTFDLRVNDPDLVCDE